MKRIGISMESVSVIFLLVSLFAVFFVALAKAGFGGMIGSLAMPLVATVSDIQTAISVLLPTYVVMDLFVAWTYRKSVPFNFLWPMAISGIIGVIIAAFVFTLIDPEYLSFLLGTMSLAIGLNFIFKRITNRQKHTISKDPNEREWIRLMGLNGASGFSSFFLMGEAPVQMFILPYKLPPKVFVATLVWFFCIINWAKIPVVIQLGLISRETLGISLLLFPAMPFGIYLGKKINDTIPKEPFYFIIHVLLLMIGGFLIFQSF